MAFLTFTDNLVYIKRKVSVHQRLVFLCCIFNPEISLQTGKYITCQQVFRADTFLPAAEQKRLVSKLSAMGGVTCAENFIHSLSSLLEVQILSKLLSYDQEEVTSTILQSVRQAGRRISQVSTVSNRFLAHSDKGVESCSHGPQRDSTRC